MMILFNLIFFLFYQIESQTCEPIDKQRWPMFGASDPKIAFVKFHKVGGTTASITLGGVATHHNWTFCCEKGCNICAMHDTLRKTRFGKKKNFDYLITLVREPIDQLFSFYRFNTIRKGEIGLENNSAEIQNIIGKKNKTNREIIEYLKIFLTHSQKTLFRWDTPWYFCPSFNWGESQNDKCGIDPSVNYFEKFDFVGMTENFDDFLVGLATIFDWRIEDLDYHKRYKQINGGPRPENFSSSEIGLLRNTDVMKKMSAIYESGTRKSNQLLDELRGTCEYQRNARKFKMQKSDIDSCSYERNSPTWYKDAGGNGKDCYLWKN